MGYDQQKLKIAIKKARSSLDKVSKMIEEDKYCIDIIQQNLAVIGLLKSANLIMLEWHLNSCVKGAMKEKDEEKISRMIQELLDVVKTAQNK